MTRWIACTMLAALTMIPGLGCASAETEHHDRGSVRFRVGMNNADGQPSTQLRNEASQETMKRS